MKILVIGASSFSGKHFSKYARKKGAEVLEASLRHWSGLLQPVDYCVNFAALNVVAPSWEYPTEYLRVNAQETTLIMRELEVKKYLHVSTPEVYGNVFGKIQEDQPFNPSTPYAVSRVAAEHMARCYHARYKLPVVFTRACNVYGPGQQLYRLIPKLIVSIKKGIKFPLEGGGQSRRAFLHVDDMCEAYWRVLMNGSPPNAYHVSTDMQWRIVDLVQFIANRMGFGLKEVTTIAPERPGKDTSYELATARIRAMGWNDTIKIKEGIDQMIEWVNANWSTLKDAPTEYHIEL